LRKENIITLQDGGQEKKFKIKQMSASQGERFLFKILLLLGASTDTDKLTDASGFFDAISNKPYEKVQELLDILLSCISRVHDGGIESQLTPDNVDSFVEDFPTLLKLRGEAFGINNFFQRSGLDALSGLKEGNITIKRKG
jgi:hypothetical protein